MSREQNKGYKGRVESIGSLIFLVMILAVSINQAQTGNNALILGSMESTQMGGRPSAIRTNQATQELEEAQTDNVRNSTLEQLASAPTQQGNEIPSVIDRALKYLANTYAYAFARVQK